MGDLFKVKIKWSTSHLFFPRIIAWVLVILAVILLIQRALKCKREGTPFFAFKNYRFFLKDFDKPKLFGSVILMAGYFACLEPMGFLWASILFVFLFNALYSEAVDLGVLFHKREGAVIHTRNLLISVGSAVVISTFIWWLFGIAFNITLP